MLLKILIEFKDYSSYIGDKLIKLSTNDKKVNLTGENLIKLYNGIVTANIIESQKVFEKGSSDSQQLSEKLIQMTANNNKESNDNILSFEIDEDGQFTIPLFEGSLEFNSSSMILGMFKRLVNKQTIKGGSAVQISPMGMSETAKPERSEDLKYITDKDENILYAEAELPWDLNYTDANGKSINLEFNDWCNPDGTLKLGKVLEESDPNYKYNKSYVDSDGVVHMPLIEESYPKILNLLAYRIPTENFLFCY